MREPRTSIIRYPCYGVCFILLACSNIWAQASVALRGGEIVKAGEIVNLIVTLDKPPNFEGGDIQVTVKGPGITISYAVAAKPGQRVYRAPFQVPPAAPPGTWSISRIGFSGGGPPLDLAFRGLSFTVIPQPGLIFPSAAEVSINPSQIQLLRREAGRLQWRVQSLKADLL
jgi:hypothetical protein